MSDPLYIVVMAAVIGFLIVSIIWHTWRSRAAVTRWARLNSFELLDVQSRCAIQGPWTSQNTDRVVYRIRVRDRHGVELQGWITPPSWPMGFFSDTMLVSWDAVFSITPAEDIRRPR